MSELVITFRLGERDQRRLRGMLRKVAAVANDQSEAAIILAAERVAMHARVAKPPKYILDRIAKLDRLTALLNDRGWPLPASVRQAAVAGLAYFANPNDLIPDQIPGLGFLDDAIMIELVMRDLAEELRGYDQFCRYREALWEKRWYQQSRETREAKLAEKRSAIRARIEAKRKRARAGRPAGDAG